MQDSFKKEFEDLRALGPEVFVLRGSTIIVEILEREEIKSAGGIIIATDDKHTKGQSVNAHKVDVARVLMCGEGYWNEEEKIGETIDGEFVRPAHFQELEVAPGAIILLPQYSAQLLSHFPGIQRPTLNKLAMVKFDQVLAYYPSEEAYASAKAKLNG